MQSFNWQLNCAMSRLTWTAGLGSYYCISIYMCTLSFCLASFMRWKNARNDLQVAIVWWVWCWQAALTVGAWRTSAHWASAIGALWWLRWVVAIVVGQIAHVKWIVWWHLLFCFGFFRFRFCLILIFKELLYFIYNISFI